MDELVSHGMGKVTAARARLHGLGGIFATLSEQHGEVIVLLRLVRAHADKRTALWPTIRVELVSHERAERQVLYHDLLAHDETSVVAAQHEVEIAQLEDLIERIDALDVDAREWGPLFEQLADAVIAHANEEETQIFALAQQTIGATRARTLDARFVTAKREIAERL